MADQRSRGGKKQPASQTSNQARQGTSASASKRLPGHAANDTSRGKARQEINQQEKKR
jgi:hypothetical protein